MLNKKQYELNQIKQKRKKKKEKQKPLKNDPL